MVERAKHIAASVDDKFPERQRFFPKNDPYSTAPVDWARAYIQSGDVSEMDILQWFEHAMQAARLGTTTLTRLWTATIRNEGKIALQPTAFVSAQAIEHKTPIDTGLSKHTRNPRPPLLKCFLI